MGGIGRADVIRAAALATVATLACCSRTGSHVAPAHVLTIADGSGDVPTLNPHLFAETTLSYIAELSQAYLVKYDEHGRPYPELLTIVPTRSNGGISKDGNTITWHLRKGVRWSDGAPFDADDVVFSTKAVLNPANNELGREGWNLIAKIDEPDKYTVVYHLRKPYSSYLPVFFGSAGSNPDVLPQHLLARYANINRVSYNSKPVGIGPFRIVKWNRGDNVQLEANPYYFRGEPKIKHITFRFVPSLDTVATLVQTGEVQLWPAVSANYLDRVLSMTNVKTEVRESPFYFHIDFNVTRPLIADVRVRQAIRYAIDRRSMAQKIAHGHAVLQEGILPKIVPVAPPPSTVPLVAYDPGKAKQLLDAAGWRPGADGVRTKSGRRLSLQFSYYTGSPSADETAEYIRQALRSVGIEVQSRKFAPAIFFAPPQQNGVLYGATWDMTMFAWQALPVADISDMWKCNQFPPNGQNASRFCNKELDALLESIESTYDENEQRQYLARAVKIIAGNVPTIVLEAAQTGYAHSPKLTGFHPNVWTPFDNMMNVDI